MHRGGGAREVPAAEVDDVVERMQDLRPGMALLREGVAEFVEGGAAAAAGVGNLIGVAVMPAEAVGPVAEAGLLRSGATASPTLSSGEKKPMMR
ncbi:hypothetical protein ACE7GA_04555 [Roseomonas sp. CCTCC AB2023176]|uniref:hypothetical protein n=1 Tax=Roseomonas sp. CCTCC AB2023176 TaxID=3342640 RepID=UPI0035D684DC